MSNKNLARAKVNKNDEFYTRREDIDREFVHYSKHFEGKVIYCNCDDPARSNFVKYFKENFKKLKLKKLIATCYVDQRINFFKMTTDPATHVVYEGKEFEIKNLKGDGDFRRQEAIAFLKEADVVVTNPPFSFFRVFVDQLVEYKKKFLVVGNIQAISYKNVFNYFIHSKIWMGLKKLNYFLNERNEKLSVTSYWYTNLKIKNKIKPLPLTKKYDKKLYPKYDNIDAIEVSLTKDIPMDYNGVMGVPISFIEKYNRKQFEILDSVKPSVSGKDTFHRFLIRRKASQIST